MNLCTPAMVYLVLALIGMVMSFYNKFGPGSIAIKALYVVAWTWFLNFLCSKGYKTISWFLVVLPFLLMFGMIALIMELRVSHH